MKIENFLNNPQHIGDGVYVDFDGYHVTLAANHPKNIVVYLEPSVYDKLIQYIESMKDAVREK